MTNISPSSPRPRTSRAPRRGFSPVRDLPAIFWLVAVVLVAALHRQVPAPRWLLFHLLLLGAVTHSIFVWSQYFADALLHAARGPVSEHLRMARLALLNFAVVTVVAGAVMENWTVAFAGGAGIIIAVVWHGATITWQLRRSLGSRFAVTVRYYIAAACMLPVGVAFGVAMFHGAPSDWHPRLMLGHVLANIFGWIGLTVLGTIITLWPTMLRTRIIEGAERAARRSLWILALGLIVAVAGVLLGQTYVTAAGLLGYAVAIGYLARPFIGAMRAKPPVHFATWSLLAGLGWFVIVTVALAYVVIDAPNWTQVNAAVSRMTPALAVGFAAQVLLGALSYLLPVSIGRGPAGTRAANSVLDRGSTFRVTATNAGIAVFILPAPSAVRVLVSAIVLVVLSAFIPLVFIALRAARRARSTSPSERTARGPAPVAGTRPPGQRAGMAVAGLASVLLAIAGGVAYDPAVVAGGDQNSAAGDVSPTGNTTVVEVSAQDMRFSPSSVTVPAGNELRIEVTNTDDSQVHDLVLETGAATGRLSPGESTTLEAGVIGRSVDGWCSVAGHRQMGMVFGIDVSENQQDAVPDGAGTTDQHETSASADLDFQREPSESFTAYDAALPEASKSRTIRRTFRVSDVITDVAPGVSQRLWTYNRKAPGPTLRGKVGDTFEITLINDADMGHSIDFHAGELAPDEPMRTIAPGKSLTYRFTAKHSGAWLYHCATMPMSSHIANGMFGAVIIDPPDLADVDREYLLVQSELYLGPQKGSVDSGKVQREEPDAVVFNGYANQYDARPLAARSGERVRFWIVDAGPNRDSLFHIIGAQFDTVFAEGRYLLTPRNHAHGASQVLALGPAQGGFVETRFAEPGHYPFVSHLMIDAERGAHGIVRVTED